MACVGYLLAGGHGPGQYAKTAPNLGHKPLWLRSAYDTFFVPVRAALQDIPTGHRLADNGKACL